jgi:AcrR family transcriptional regulator
MRGDAMPQPLRNREDPAVRRKQIIDEAILLIGQLGYHGFTIQQLAQRCGITNGTLIYHFGTKEGLLVSVLDECDQREAESLRSLLQVKHDHTDGFKYSLQTSISLFRLIIQDTVSQPETALFRTVLQTEALNPAHPAHQHFIKRENMVMDKISALLVGHVESPVSTARVVRALIDGLIQQWLRMDRAFDLLKEWDRSIATISPFNS